MKSQLKISNKNRNRKDGQSMVEFALCIPFLFLILISILYFGRYFLMSQVLLYAAQAGANVAANTPNLSDSTTLGTVRGFDSSGNMLNTNSVIYSALNAGGLLSNGVNNPNTAGNLPNNASVQILPWDASAGPSKYVPPQGTLAVVITYPFSLLTNPFAAAGQSSGNVTGVSVANIFSAPIKFPNATITEQAVVAQQVYQQ